MQPDRIISTFQTKVPTPSSGSNNAKQAHSKEQAGVFLLVGFEVLSAVVMKSAIFWDITPCSPLKVRDVPEEHIASIFRVEK
jgi:hypothetical protein